ncbi:MAG: Ig-like domain-containing protein [Saprospiraceae bacterium]|nr:Ig-like domain-containing protein [Saprospiraceae bacterium]
MSDRILIFTCILCLILGSCASSGTLGGGPKDTKPPVLIPETSSPSYQLHSTARQFNFEFDEFVEAKDVIKQVLISPPLTYIPSIKARGKKVTFTFNEKEELKPNTTYIINFGESIRDFTEGNKLANFKYVFSTGDKIDSLMVKGKVIDSEKNEGVSGISVMLFENLQDSAILKGKPFYFAKTNAQGVFSIENIRLDTFRLVAVMDENGNLQYNELTELLAFDTRFVTWDTANVIERNLVLTRPEVTPRYLGHKAVTYGLLGIKLHTTPKEVPSYRLEPPPEFNYPELKGDSLLIWYRYQNPPDTLQWVMGRDTLYFAIPDTSAIPLKLGQFARFSSFGSLPADTLIVEYTQPLASIDVSRISLKDSTGLVPFTATVTTPLKCGIFAKMSSKKKYQLEILPGAIRDVYGNTNDTLVIDFTTYDIEKLSTLSTRIEGLDSTKQYLIRLMKGNVVFESRVVSFLATTTVEFKKLKSDEYSLAIIEDENRNGLKDEASYWQGRQAEKIRTFKLEKVRESWSLETTVQYNETTNPINSAIR